MATVTIRKTRRGTTITMRAGKGEDLRNVIKEMAKPSDPPTPPRERKPRK